MEISGSMLAWSYYLVCCLIVSTFLTLETFDWRTFWICVTHNVCDRTVAMSIFCVTARNNSQPNISLVQRTSKIVWSFDLTLVLTASLAKFLILRRLIGLSKRLGSSLHSSWNWSLQIVPESTVLVRSFCTSDEAAQPVVRQNNLCNKLSWNWLSVSSGAFMIFCRSELSLTILYGLNSSSSHCSSYCSSFPSLHILCESSNTGLSRSCVTVHSLF